MKTRKYYWTVVILAVLFVFVIAMDVAGFIGLFTGGGEDAPVYADEIVATDEGVAEEADAADAEDTEAAEAADDADAPADMPQEEPEDPVEPEEPEAPGDAA